MKKNHVAENYRDIIDIDAATVLGLVLGILLHLLILFVALMTPVAAHAEVGELRVWGTAGKRQFNVGSGSAEVRGIVSYPNGSMVVATNRNAQPALDWCFTKINASAQVDTTWGIANSGSVIEATPEQDLLYGVVPTDNGGWFAYGSCAGIGCIIKYHANGARDSAFGIAGQRKITDPVITDLKVAADGRMTYAAECAISFVQHACVGRLLPTSLADPSFNNGQQRVFAMGAVNANSGYTITSIALDPIDSKTWVTGNCRENGKFEFCVARLNSDGSLDAAYASITGWARFSIGGIEDMGLQILARPDGAALIVGTCRADATDAFRKSFCVAQLVPWTAALDSSFGDSGKRMIDVLMNGNNRIVTRSATLQEDGALSLFGECLGSTATARACMALIGGNGRDDGRLRNVRAVLDLDDSDATSSANVGASPLVREFFAGYHVTVFGACGANGTSTPCLTRLEWAYPRGGACGMDIDGDGKVMATTDGVILTRIAAGMRGQSVLTGVAGQGAIRSSWDRVRDYLIRDCGMTIAP